MGYLFGGLVSLHVKLSLARVSPEHGEKLREKLSNCQVYACIAWSSALEKVVYRPLEVFQIYLVYVSTDLLL